MADDYNDGYYSPSKGYGSGGGYTHRSKMPKANTSPGNANTETTADDLILPRRNERD